MNSTDKIAILALGVSIFAVILSYIFFLKTDELAKKGFNRGYRPYIVGLNYAQQKADSIINHPNIVQIRVFNAPAKMKIKYLSYFIKDNDKEILLFEQPTVPTDFVYPLDKNEILIISNRNIITHENMLQLLPKKVIRKLRIEYEWISDSSDKYFFESIYEYDPLQQYWALIKQDAN